jgi:hypothetical protein
MKTRIGSYVGLQSRQFETEFGLRWNRGMNAIWTTASSVVVAVLLLNTPHVVAGYPQPYQHPGLFRQANMVMLKFQEALAAKRWEEALSFCSDRVRQRARELPWTRSG